MYQALTPDDIQSDEHKSLRDKFYKSVSYKLVPLVSSDYFECFGIEDTPTYDFYDYDTKTIWNYRVTRLVVRG